MAEASFLRSFTFNGQKTSHLFQIEKISIPFLSKENEYYEVGNTDGSNFFHTRISKNSIKIDGYLLKDNSNMTIYKIKDELVKILNTDEPVKLVFDQLPDRYFNAIFSGSVDHDVTNPDQTSVSLTFDVPDGLAHQIEPNTFTNVYSTSRNLILDSEYKKKDVYLHQGVKLAEEKHNGSSIVYVDYREGIPYGGSAQDEYVWLPIQSMNRRNLPELQVGQDVNFSIEAKVLAIDEDDTRPEAGNLVLEEWSVNPSKVLRTHFINIPKEVGDFKKYGKVIKITDPNTKALNVNYGITGLDTIIHWSKPMLSLLPPLGATVTAPSVGANLYSNSLDFGDYDYSTAPNLMRTIKFSDLSTMNTPTGTVPTGVTDKGDYFEIDLTTMGVTEAKVLWIPMTPRPQIGKQYTYSIELMCDEGEMNEVYIRPYFRNADGTGGVAFDSITKTVTSTWKRYSRLGGKATDEMVNSTVQALQFYFPPAVTRRKLYIRYNIMVQEGDQTSSQTTGWKPNLLDAPYYLSKVPLGENIADPKVKFPINTSEYSVYIGYNTENYVDGETYTVTLKGTKPSSERWGVYLDRGRTAVGTMNPVEGKIDEWELTFTVNNSSVINILNIYQLPSSGVGACKIDWIKLEKGDTRTPNISYYKYKGFAPAPSNNPKDYHWEYEPSYYQAINYEPSTTGISDLLKVQNNGTYKTTPRFIFTTQGENGLVALAKDDGSLLQFGNPEEVDNVTNVASQQVVSWSFYGSQLPVNMEVNAPIGSSTPYFSNNPSTPNIIQGSWNMDLDVDSALPVWIPGETKEVWHGPTLRHAIPLDSTGNRNGEFSTHNRFRFYTPNQKHRGRIEYVISDDNVENYLGFVLRDSAITNTNMVMECWYKGKLLKSINVSRKEFTKDFFEINMYRYKKSLKWRLVQVKGITNNNTVIIDKQVVFDYNLDEEDTTPIKYWGVWTERYQNSNYIRPFVTDTQFRWISTPVVQNIRNYFQDGDIIEIDVKSRQILVNGVINNELNVVGNQWGKFTLGLGETTIQPIVSSWANPAEVICVVEESYL